MASLKRRGKTYYLRYYLAGKQREKSLDTNSYQVARELQRQYESAEAQGTQNPLPTTSKLADVLQAYTEHVRASKPPKSAQTDIYYLREAFGPICEGLQITSRRPPRRRRTALEAQPIDRRCNDPRIEANALEQVTTEQIATFIDHKVRNHGIKPKTANHYRSILRRLFNWSTEVKGVKLPGNINPATKVKPYRETAPQIRFLTLPQIDEQLNALENDSLLQTMVATLIYAGLRREELLWLTKDDIVMPKGNKPGMIRVRAKTINGRFWQPKTGVNRAVPINSSLLQYFERYSPQETIQPSTDRHFRGWWFPSPSRKQWDPDNYSLSLRAVAVICH